jgi:hypothetical protein
MLKLKSGRGHNVQPHREMSWRRDVSDCRLNDAKAAVFSAPDIAETQDP